MNKFGHAFLGILFLLSFAPVAAATVVVPVGTTPADDIIFNFDFTGLTPAPPYTEINLEGTVASGFPADIITIDIFAGLNGTGGLVRTGGFNVPRPFNAFSTLLSNPGVIDDGVFSVGFRSAATPQGIDTLTAAGFGTDAIVTINGVPVPEPATLALLCLGLFGLAATRRRSH